MILTISTHIFREAYRKRLPHILIGLGLLIMLVSPLILTTDEPDSLVKIIMVIFFQVVVLLSIIGIVLFSAMSLPQEIEDKTILGVLSKPISRLHFVLGKIAGFSLVSACILVVLGIVHVIVIYHFASRLPEDYQGIMKAREVNNASHFEILGNMHHAGEGIGWIKGGQEGFAVWSFTNVYEKEEEIPPFEADLNLRLESDRGIVDSIPLVVRIENASTGEQQLENFPAKIDEPVLLKINPEILLNGNNIRISLFPINKEDYVGVSQHNVKLCSIQKAFLFNYGKALSITFLKFLLIIVIAVMGSTYLSAPISILAAIAIFFCGHLLDFLKDFSNIIHGFEVHSHGLPVEQEKPSIILVYMQYILKKPLEWLSFLLPDFKKFDILGFLLNGIDIPLATIWFCIGYTAMYVSICLIISSLILRKREFF